ncbi:MAG: hypothetical protein A2026_17535 [Deltaproteobacteria bacterium RBG_19FT_COMBO_46_12]|nr:MAG: hypothetical protein A2026_17535 [Deltaproteobacteria bacterium RBG_19FT_COMBO_46_12]
MKVESYGLILGNDIEHHENNLEEPEERVNCHVEGIPRDGKPFALHAVNPITGEYTNLTNIGITCLEELGNLDEVIESEEKGTSQRGKLKPFPKKVVKAQVSASDPNNGNGRGARPADTVNKVENKPPICLTNQPCFAKNITEGH